MSAKKPAHLKTLAKTKVDGRFYREIGKKQNGKAPRFYLGHDEVKARYLIQKLEATWEGVKRYWGFQIEIEGEENSPPFACWDETTLQIGHAVAKGEPMVEINIPEDMDKTSGMPKVWLSTLQECFSSIIVLKLADKNLEKESTSTLVKEYDQEKKEAEEKHLKEINRLNNFYLDLIPPSESGETLHSALNRYKNWLENDHYIDVNGKTTQAGKKQGDRVLRIQRHSKDMHLSQFGETEIENLIDFWRKRPAKSDGKKYAFTVCKHTIRLLKHFIKWLHKEKSFNWKKPPDLEIDRIKIIPDLDPKYKVEVYSVDELKILWKYSTVFEAKLILLALNCGFSIQEIGTLNWKDINGETVRGLRPKSKVYGEFLLWENTRKMIGEPKNEGLVITTNDGKSLYSLTKGNNVSAKIPNAWYRLIKRVRKHHPEFKRLGFHHLRKTAGNLIRQVSDGETAGVFLRHGKPVKTDLLIGIYSNPAFERVFDAQKKVFEILRGIFEPKDDEIIPKKLSKETVAEIKREKKMGTKTKFLAKKFGVSESTIRAYGKPPKIPGKPSE